MAATVLVNLCPFIRGSNTVVPRITLASIFSPTEDDDGDVDET